MTFNISNPIGTGTDQELLEFTRAAIAQITLGGQVIAFGGGKTLTRANLAELRDQERQLEDRIAAAADSTGTSRKNYAEFRRPL